MNKLLASLLLTMGVAGMASANEPAAADAIVGDAAAGKGKTALCAACHGADGNSMAPTFPKLAGQGERYLIKQMNDIKSGARVVVPMTGMLNNMSEQDIADIAAYFASKKIKGGQANPDLVARGEALYRGGKLEDGMPACTGCHAPDGSGNNQGGFPALGGQHADYIALQLTAFREGERTNDGDAMIMRDIAAKLSNKDIKAISSYIQGLH